MQVKLIIGDKHKAAERSRQDPGVLVVAARSYASGKSDRPSLSIAYNIAYQGRVLTTGPNIAGALVFIGAHGSATSGEIARALYDFQPDGGPDNVAGAVANLRFVLRKTLGKLGLSLETYWGVDPMRPRLRIAGNKADDWAEVERRRPKTRDTGVELRP